jgi:hypothetical protein
MYLALTDGTTTVILNYDGSTVAAGLLGARYFPTDSGEDTATETINQVFSGTVADVRATFSTIRRLLRDAQERTAGNKRIDALYLVHNPAGGVSGAYRSEVTGGRVGWSEQRTLRQMSGVTDTAGETGIFIERLNYFEDVAETQIVTNWTILNGNNLPYNYATLGTIVGNLPAPIRVEIRNTSGGDVNADDFYLNIDAFVGMTTNEHLLAGDSAVWGANLTDSTHILEAAIPDAVLVKCAGQEMNILAAFSTLSSSVYLRAVLYTVRDGLYLPSIRGKEVYANSRELINLGSLPIPASGYATGSSSVVLGIVGRSVLAGAATLEFIQIMPAAGMVNLYYNDFDMVDDGAIFDDGTMAYYQESGNKFDTVFRIGGPLLAIPGKTNRLTMLMDEGTLFDETKEFLINAWYRPRRSTV